ncbi:MAG: hypothetical protein AAFV74_23635 [Pseudomonadota bacterium]
MSYQCLFQLRVAGLKEHPISLQGASLDESFNPKSLNTEGSPEWHTPVVSVHYPREKALAFPDELWLNTGERKLDFDIRLDLHGLILSERLTSFMGDDFAGTFKVAKLHVVNRKGSDISARPMVYAKPRNPVPVFEPETTVFVRGMVTTGLFPQEVDLAERIVLREDLSGPIVYPRLHSDFVLISDAVADWLRKESANGVDIVPVDGFCDRYNDRFTMMDADGNPVSPFG